MTTPVDELRKKRHLLIQKFLDENADVLGITSTDDVGTGPFVLTDWCMVIHLRDLSVDDYSCDSNEVRAAFFRPGMGYSQKLGLIASFDEAARVPRALAPEEDY